MRTFGLGWQNPHLGPKTKEVGGGPATGLANSYIGFLQRGLSSGSFGGQNTLSTPRGGVGGGMPGNLPQGIFPGQNPAMPPGFRNPQSGGMGGALDTFLSGNLGGTDTSALKNNTGGFQFADFNPNTIDFSKFDSSISLPGFNSNSITTNPLFTAALANAQKTMSAPTGLEGGREVFNISDPGNPGTGAAEAFLNRQRMKDVANLRARYGAAGGLALGTPGSTAEGQFLADSGAADAATLAQIARGDAALRQQGELGAGNINANLYGSYLDALGQARGQGFSQGGNILSILAGALGQEGQLGLGARGQDLDALVRSKGLELEGMKSASDQSLTVQSLLNQNQGMQAQNQLGNRGLDIDALSRALSIDEQGRQHNTGLSQNTLINLLNQYANLSGKGISQRQTVQTPGALGQIAGIAGGIAGMVNPIAGAMKTFGLGGGGNGFSPAPSFDLSNATQGLNLSWLRPTTQPVAF